MTINQRAEQLRHAIQLFAKTLPEKEILKVATVFNKWESDRRYKVGDYCLYGENINKDPRVYKCLKDHISSNKRTPGKVKTFFKEIGIDINGYPIFIEPTGIEDAYMEGDVINYNDCLYKCLKNLTILSPEEAPELWEKIPLKED